MNMKNGHIEPVPQIYEINQWEPIIKIMAINDWSGSFWLEKMF